MSRLIVSVSGVRGILGDTLTPEAIVKFVSAFAEYSRNARSGKKSKIIIGRDGRLHGGSVQSIVNGCISLSGMDVADIGVAPTPTVQYMTESLKAAGGISVTASHNPQEWNGLKFLNPDGTFLDESQISKLIRIAEKNMFSYADNPGVIRTLSFEEAHLKHIDSMLKLRMIDADSIRKRKFRVVVDAVNSSGSVIVTEFLKRLRCDVIELFCDGSGKFPHTPEPVPANLTKLSSAVKKHKADLGIAVDPDADRLVLITNSGKPFGEENTITTSVRFVFRNSAVKTATVNLSTTRAVDDVAKEFSGKVFRSPVGEINVVKEMQRNGSVIGGEGSGGVILPAAHYGRDSLAGIVLILSELANSGQTLDEYKSTLPQYHISKGKIENVKNTAKQLERFRKAISGRKDLTGVNNDDGLKLDFEEFWVHMRMSNTEPIVRIITEARSKKQAESVQSEFMEKFRSLL